MLPEVVSKALPRRLQCYELFKLDQFTNLMNLGVVIYEAGFYMELLASHLLLFRHGAKALCRHFPSQPQNRKPSFVLMSSVPEATFEIVIGTPEVKKPQLEGLSVTWKKSGKTRIRPQQRAKYHSLG